ncbi:hypothetical protein HanRHA438_Chr12g0552371 [Helianthus annuus]|nr:hypothetical protein HanHA89_Chr12g0468631 [Helianthus annuus]KAJ0744514.1 hypothetical protein HanPI659440_Chr10g0388481 [Helianthus annuus]KAJ0862686.1 hypothetical protein HanPSC8_Chr12g0521161 [Helianthus annuus]KAJ0866491.1 hypothetical protein HanRHA438_Chr12g0552371 [Helianthus annuus]
MEKNQISVVGVPDAIPVKYMEFDPNIESLKAKLKEICDENQFMCSYKNLRKNRVIGSLVAAIQKLHEVKVDRMLLCKFQIKNQLSAVFISPHPVSSGLHLDFWVL